MTLAAAITAFGAVAMPFTPAHAQMDLHQIYLGWDFGVGQVPSAYNPYPTYGWPFYLGRCVPVAPTIR
jgi:hypothetical protein